MDKIFFQSHVGQPLSKFLKYIRLNLLYNIISSYTSRYKDLKRCWFHYRCDIFLRYKAWWRFDGLNTLRYSVVTKEKRKLFNRILVDIDTETMRKVNLTLKLHVAI